MPCIGVPEQCLSVFQRGFAFSGSIICSPRSRRFGHRCQRQQKIVKMRLHPLNRRQHLSGFFRLLRPRALQNRWTTQLQQLCHSGCIPLLLIRLPNEEEPEKYLRQTHGDCCHLAVRRLFGHQGQTSPEHHLSVATDGRPRHFGSMLHLLLTMSRRCSRRG